MYKYQQQKNNAQVIRMPRSGTGSLSVLTNDNEGPCILFFNFLLLNTMIRF